MSAPGLRLITTFGLGHLRPFPGTWGSLPPVAAAAIMLGAGAGPTLAPGAPGPAAWGVSAWIVYHAVLLTVVLVFSLACVMAGDRAEARYWRKDPSQVVADETAGMCLPLMFLPAWSVHRPVAAALTLLVAFVAFRVMDILKPWPARQLQRVPGGWGILIDDVVAGLYAAVIVQVATRWLV